MATLPVKFFTSSMQGAPQLSNNWGVLTALLDACLITGFNLKSVGTLTSSAGVATASIPVGHQYLVDQVVEIAGADQSAYNGEFRVLSATSSQFTFAVEGAPVSPATGSSITVKVAALNFEVAFTGTNKRAYRSKNPASNRPYLRVDNSLDPAYSVNYAKKAKVTMAEAMTDIDTFVPNTGRAPFDPTNPSRNEIGTGTGASAVDGWYKWYYARDETYYPETAAPGGFDRNWVLVGDDRGFFLFTSHNGGLRALYIFSDFESFRSADGFNTLLTASDRYCTASTSAYETDNSAYNGADTSLHAARTADATGKICMRSHLQVGPPARLFYATLGTKNGQSVSGYDAGLPWPNGPDYGLVLHPVYLQEEGAGHLRGKMPGLLWVLNNNPLGDLSIVGNVAGFPGRKFVMVDVAHGYANTQQAAARVALDITGPWW